MKAKIWMLCFVLCLCSCKNLFKDEEFSIKCVSYTGSELRIDGYYYIKSTFGDKKYINCFIFYFNGVSSPVQTEADNLNDVESSIASRSENKYLKNNLYAWGPFSIYENTLRMQYYEPSDYLSKRVLELTCTILNDSTFYLEKIHLVSTGQEITERFFNIGEYRFKQFSHKPDSTNNFLP